MNKDKQVLIFGATGNVGGAAARKLLKRGWYVRAVTRSPERDKAIALAALGADVIQADMENQASLEIAFQGMKNVFSVQNPWVSGSEAEIRQGKLVADVAKQSGIDHLVYSSAGTGMRNTGVPHFDNKVEIETHMRNLELPVSIIRPGPFFELLTNKQYVPPLVSWGAEPKVIGWDTPKPWIAVRDVGVAAANMFDNPHKWIGCDVSLFGDVKTLAECKAAIIASGEKKPFGIPIPIWLFKKMVGPESVLMWHWLIEWVEKNGRKELLEMVEASREVCPDMLDLESWLANRQSISMNKQQVTV